MVLRRRKDSVRFPRISHGYRYDMIGAWSVLSGRDPVPVSMFWGWVGRECWEQMPKSDQFWLIEAAASLVGQKNVLIASSPTKSPDCLFGKYQWLETHCPDWIKRQYAITPRKHWLAQPGVLLIDDCDDNCNLFMAHGGGEAILVPRPWNSLHEMSDNCSNYLSKKLSKVIGQK